MPPDVMPELRVLAAEQSWSSRWPASALTVLPAELLHTVCSFLSLPELLCSLSGTCRGIGSSVTLRHSHLPLHHRQPPWFTSCSPRTRRLLSTVQSASIVYSFKSVNSNDDNSSDPAAVSVSLSLSSLSSSVDPHPGLLRLPALQRLFIGFEDVPDSNAQWAAALQALLQLLGSHPLSFSALTRLHIRSCDNDSIIAAPVSFGQLSCLHRLSCLRVDNLYASSFTYSSLLSSLSSLPSLEPARPQCGLRAPWMTSAASAQTCSLCCLRADCGVSCCRPCAATGPPWQRQRASSPSTPASQA